MAYPPPPFKNLDGVVLTYVESRGDKSLALKINGELVSLKSWKPGSDYWRLPKGTHHLIAGQHIKGLYFDCYRSSAKLILEEDQPWPLKMDWVKVKKSTPDHQTIVRTFNLWFPLIIK